MSRITLYKYRHIEDENHLRLLTHGELHFSSPERFWGDDPLDSAIPLRMDLGSYTQILNVYTDEVQRQRRDLDRKQATKIVQRILRENDPYSAKEVTDFGNRWKKRFSERVGVCSLARNPNSLFMWKHYGKEHTGFCVGLDWDNMIEWTQELKKRARK